MTLFQIAAVLFAIFMAYVIRVHRLEAKLSSSEALLWYGLWTVFAILAIFPDYLIEITDYFYFDRVFDLLVVGAFMVLSFLVIRSYLKYREIQITLERIVRSQAIQNLDKELRSKKLKKLKNKKFK